MPPKEKKSREQKNLGYEIFIGALSVLSILNLVLGWLYRYDQNMQYVVFFMNALFLPIFLGDFLYRFFTTDSKSNYFFREFGWADLVSSLPLANAKILRVFRLWRVIRMMRTFGFRGLVRAFMEDRAGNVLLTVGFLVICVVEFGALAELKVEAVSPSANITNASDAIWYVYVTITTVGYGDHYPVTNAGRIVGVIIMTAGVGLFGTLSGYVANTFLSPGKKKEEPETALLAADDPRVKIAEIQRMLEQQERTTADLKVKLDEVSRLL